MELAKIKQRLEILWKEVEKLEAAGGGGSPTDAYTKAQTDALLNTKADKSTTYTKTEVDYEIDSEVGTAIAALDVSSTAATGHVIRSIAQEDGKIAAVAELVDTTPTTGSTKLCTSGGIYEAIQAAGGGGTDLTPTNVGAKASTFPEEYIGILQKHLPFTTTNNPPSNYYSNIWTFYGETSTAYYYINYLVYVNSLTYPHYRIATINKSDRNWSQSQNIYHFITNNNKTEVFEQNNNRLTNQDLNGLGVGIYHCTDTTNITNSPTTDAFIIEVIDNTHKSGISTNMAKKQILTTLTSTPKTYYRVYSTAQSNTWSSWYEITATPVS